MCVTVILSLSLFFLSLRTDSFRLTFLVFCGAYISTLFVAKDFLTRGSIARILGPRSLGGTETVRVSQTATR